MEKSEKSFEKILKHNKKYKICFPNACLWRKRCSHEAQTSRLFRCG